MAIFPSVHTAPSLSPSARSRRGGPPSVVALLVMLAALLFAAVAGAQAPDPQAEFDEDDPVLEVLANPWLDNANPWLDNDLRSPSQGDSRLQKSGSFFDWVYTVPHDVPLATGGAVRVYEHFTLRSFLRWPRRAVVAPSSFYATAWRIPVEGYDGAAILARRGFLIYTLDLVGYGDSFAPPNGNDADFPAQIDAVRTVASYVKARRHVRPDILGEGYGASIAAELAAEPGLVRSVVLTDNLYRVQLGGPASDPAFRELLSNDPDGYIFVPPEAVSLFLVDSPQAVADYYVNTQAGLYPVPSFTVSFELPFYDPTDAQVPGLVVHSENDLVSPPSDAADLAADYGSGGAQLVILEGAFRGARFGAPSSAEAYWDAVLGFLDP